MNTISLQKTFLNLGLNIKDFFLYCILQKFVKPITLKEILKCYPLLNLQRRQYSTILNKLADFNLLAKEKIGLGLIFRFPYITGAKNRTYRAFNYSKKMPQLLLNLCRKMLQSADIVNNNKYKNNIYNLHYVVDIASGVVKNKITKAGVSLHLQIKKAFKKAFPEKNNFIKDQLPNNFDISLLISKINESEFLKSRKFVNLNWCIKNYDAIISGYYKSYVEDKLASPKPPAQDFQQREYTREELNGLFDSLEDL